MKKIMLVVLLALFANIVFAAKVDINVEMELPELVAKKMFQKYIEKATNKKNHEFSVKIESFPKSLDSFIVQGSFQHDSIPQKAKFICEIFIAIDAKEPKTLNITFKGKMEHKPAPFGLMESLNSMLKIGITTKIHQNELFDKTINKVKVLEKAKVEVVRLISLDKKIYLKVQALLDFKF